MTTAYLGIDPGVNGGAALIHGRRVTVISFPREPAELWNAFATLIGFPHLFDDLEAVMEFNSGYVGGNSGRGNPGSSMFTFGMAHGYAEMALVALDFLPRKVRPWIWQRALGIEPKRKHTDKVKVRVTRGKNKGKWREKGVGGEDASDFKARLLDHARALYPQVILSAATGDALLIAHYAKLTSGGREDGDGKVSRAEVLPRGLPESRLRARR